MCRTPSHISSQRSAPVCLRNAWMSGSSEDMTAFMRFSQSVSRSVPSLLAIPQRCICHCLYMSFQDGSAAAKMLFVFHVVQRPAQIDEVKIDAIENRPAQVGAT